MSAWQAITLSRAARRSTRSSSRSGATRRRRSSRRRRTRSRRSTTRTSTRSGSARGASASTWFEPFTKLYEWELPYAKWFLGGKLNVAYNCVDRHVEAGRGDKVAFHWEGEPEDDRRDHHLRRPAARGRRARERAQGARRDEGHAGRRSTWAWSPRRRSRCSRARGSARRTRSSSAASRPTRSPTGCNDMGCEVLITQDEAWRRGTTVPLKRTADEALADAPGVKQRARRCAAPATTCR